ncbi:uncharacterized protein [Penaeus vannamei]|uniref:uncharacterized protein n=1 Tax=Penaeus vannamei TaxID=6689 RepID=UPI00387F638D
MRLIFDCQLGCVHQLTELSLAPPVVGPLSLSKQSVAISPKLFTTCLEEIFKKLDWNGKDTKIGNEHLNNLIFADDIVLFSEGQRPLPRARHDRETLALRSTAVSRSSTRSSGVQGHLRVLCYVGETGGRTEYDEES